MTGTFFIKVEPKGIVRFQKLSEQLRTEFPPEEPPRIKVKGFAG